MSSVEGRMKNEWEDIQEKNKILEENSKDLVGKMILNGVDLSARPFLTKKAGEKK